MYEASTPGTALGSVSSSGEARPAAKGPPLNASAPPPPSSPRASTTLSKLFDVAGVYFMRSWATSVAVS